MTDVRPLRGWRFTGHHDDISSLIAPPYDVIGHDLDDRLRARDPHNIVRLILPRDQAEHGSRYRAAHDELQEWTRNGVLQQDSEPSFYPYRQTYRVKGAETSARIGCMGLLRLQPFGSKVMAHEQTLEGPKDDRFRLLAATRSNLSPVFVLFHDPNGEASALLGAAMRTQPVSRAQRPGGELDEMWRLSDPAALGRLQETLSGRNIVFADGHHRYEAALRYLQTLEAAGKAPGSAAYCLTFFAPTPQPGLNILPTHRIVHDVPPERIQGLQHNAAEDFDVRAICPWQDEHGVRAWEAGAVAKSARVVAYAVPHDPNLYELTLRPEAADRVLAHLQPSLRQLDVSVLHVALLEKHLGIGGRELAQHTSVRYTHESTHALAALRDGAQAAFLVRPTAIDSVFDVAGAGLRMPQKSTYFYPKLATGFVLHRHQ